MPVYNEKTFFYELLLRGSEIAPNEGALIGGYVRTITHTTKDGVLFGTPTLNDPEQLALFEGEAGQKLGDLLGQLNAATIIDNQNLADALADEQLKTSGLSAALLAEQSKATDLQGAVVSLNESLAEAQAEIQRLTELASESSMMVEPETEPAATAE
jgi:hypothetical protein